MIRRKWRLWQAERKWKAAQRWVEKWKRLGGDKPIGEKPAKPKDAIDTQAM